MTNTLGIIIENNRPVVSSRKVAEIFEKLHFHVMESIRKLECGTFFNESNFRLVDICTELNHRISELLDMRQKDF